MSGSSGHRQIAAKANCQLLDLNDDRKSYFLTNMSRTTNKQNENHDLVDETTHF